MPPIRSLVFKCYILLISSITFNGEIMSPYSYYIKKGLVYIVIIDLSNYQLFFYSKYIKLNTCVLYNMRSVSLNKCIFFIYFTSLRSL